MKESGYRGTDPDFEKQLAGYSLATAEITYRMPDAPSLLQTFLWQQYDMAPRFPKLLKFLNFWTAEIDGPLHSVRLCHAELLRPVDVTYTGHEITLH